VDAKDLFPYYLGRLDDMPGLVCRSTSLKVRVSMQMRRHIERINSADGLGLAPVLAPTKCDFEALA
jgi:hypothetical protein